jgi:hypothetical protein
MTAPTTGKKTTKVKAQQGIENGMPCWFTLVFLNSCKFLICFSL